MVAMLLVLGFQAWRGKHETRSEFAIVNFLRLHCVTFREAASHSFGFSSYLNFSPRLPFNLQHIFALQSALHSKQSGVIYDLAENRAQSFHILFKLNIFRLQLVHNDGHDQSHNT